MIPSDSKLPKRSYEVLDEVISRGDAIELARDLSCSPQLVRSWCRRPETEDEFSTGKYNPLDRLRTIIIRIKEDTGEVEQAYPIGAYIAELLGGVFVPVPGRGVSRDDEIMQRISSVLKETGEAIECARVAWYDDSAGKISKNERKTCVNEINEAIVALNQLKNWIDDHARR